MYKVLFKSFDKSAKINLLQYFGVQQKPMETTQRTIGTFQVMISLSENKQQLSFFCQDANKHAYLMGEFNYQKLTGKQKQYIDNVSEFFVLIREVRNDAIRIQSNVLAFDVHFGSLKRTLAVQLIQVPQIIAKKITSLEIKLKQIAEEKQALKLKCEEFEQSLADLNAEKQEQKTVEAESKIKTNAQKTRASYQKLSALNDLFGATSTKKSCNPSASRSVTENLHHSYYQERDIFGRFC